MQRLGHPLDWRHDDRIRHRRIAAEFFALAAALRVDSPTIMEFTERASFWLTNQRPPSWRGK